jgi:hypothetical protein
MATAPPSDIVAEIQRLKKIRNAVILAHNYERPEVQDIADAVRLNGHHTARAILKYDNPGFAPDDTPEKLIVKSWADK